MRFLLVQPRVSPEVSFPMGLASVAAILREAGHQLAGVDLHLEDESEVERRARRHRADAVLITAWSDAYAQLVRICRQLRSRWGGPIVLGGPHVTALPEQTLRDTGAQLAVLGEGEDTLRDLLDGGLLGGPKLPAGCARIDAGGAFERSARRRPIADLDALPFADRQVFPLSRYCRGMRSHGYPYTTLITSRGCNRACDFCPSPLLWPGRFRPHSPPRILEEMARLHRDHGIVDFHIEDDYFFADRARVEALCELLAQEQRPWIFECLNGVKPEDLDEALLRTLHRAGCRRITLSIERFEQSVAQPRPGLQADLAHVQRLTAEASRLGLGLGGYFMIGLPGESRADMQRTVALALRSGVDSANFSVYHPLPGSPMGRKWSELRDQVPDSGLARGASLRAHLRFFARPQPLRELLRALGNRPALIPALGGKALGLLRGREDRVLSPTAVT